MRTVFTSKVLAVQVFGQRNIIFKNVTVTVHITRKVCNYGPATS